MKTILAFSNSDDATVDAVSAASTGSVKIVRINTDTDLVEIEHSSEAVNNDFKNIDAIWYRRPFESYDANTELTSDAIIYKQESSEMLWNHLLLVSKDKWINFPAENWLAERKLVQLRQAKKYGLITPKWLISRDAKIIQEFIRCSPNGCIAKPIDNGYIPHGNDLSIIYTSEITMDSDFSSARNCPTLIQYKIPKIHDVRSIYIDGHVLYVGIETRNLDCRRDEMRDAKYSIVNPPQNVHNAYINFIKSFGLRFSTSDFVLTPSGEWVFLENNPNGNWAWLEEYFPGVIVDHFLSGIK